MFVFSTDMGRRLFENAVRLMTAVHIRLAGAAPQAERMQQKLQDIRIIDKAKCLLIQYSGLTEEEAHRYVEKQAMDRRLSRRPRRGGNSRAVRRLIRRRNRVVFEPAYLIHTPERNDLA